MDSIKVARFLNITPLFLLSSCLAAASTPAPVALKKFLLKYAKYDGYQSEITSANYIYVYLKKKSSYGVIRSKIISNQRLSDLATRKLKTKKCNLYSFYKDNIWRADLADMQLINKYNKGF